MVNQSQNPGPRYLLDKVLAVCLIAWLLFFGGISQLKALLTPSRLSQVGQIGDTIRTGADRVIAPGARLPSSDRPAAPGTAPRSGAPVPAANPPAASQAQIDAAADAVYEATAQASIAAVPNVSAPAVAPVVSDPATWPTAAILMPTAPPVAQAVVVPQAMPVLASNDPPTITPIPTLPIPTPLAAVDYTVSADGKCVIAPRDGTLYQVCQDWKYAPHEIASVAGYIRSGLIPGVEVQ